MQNSDKCARMDYCNRLIQYIFRRNREIPIVVTLVTGLNNNRSENVGNRDV